MKEMVAYGEKSYKLIQKPTKSNIIGIQHYLFILGPAEMAGMAEISAIIYSCGSRGYHWLANDLFLPFLRDKKIKYLWDTSPQNR